MISSTLKHLARLVRLVFGVLVAIAFWALMTAPFWAAMAVGTAFHGQ